MRLNKRYIASLMSAGILLALTACAPEGQRDRGGDAGGDIRNLSDSMSMHGEDDAMDRIYYQTPRMGQGIERSQDARADDDES
jgi:hypothetical protein